MIKFAWVLVVKCEFYLFLRGEDQSNRILLRLLFVFNIHCLVHYYNSQINHHICHSNLTNFSMIFCILIHRDILVHLSIDFHSFWYKDRRTKNQILQVNSNLPILSYLVNLMICIKSLHMKCASFYSILFTILRICKLLHVL